MAWLTFFHECYHSRDQSQNLCQEYMKVAWCWYGEKYIYIRAVFEWFSQAQYPVGKISAALTSSYKYLLLHMQMILNSTIKNTAHSCLGATVYSNFSLSCACKFLSSYTGIPWNNYLSHLCIINRNIQHLIVTLRNAYNVICTLKKRLPLLYYVNFLTIIRKIWDQVTHVNACCNQFKCVWDKGRLHNNDQQSIIR